jgi:hypothetical protein
MVVQFWKTQSKQAEQPQSQDLSRAFMSAVTRRADWAYVFHGSCRRWRRVGKLATVKWSAGSVSDSSSHAMGTETGAHGFDLVENAAIAVATRALRR